MSGIGGREAADLDEPLAPESPESPLRPRGGSDSPHRLRLLGDQRKQFLLARRQACCRIAAAPAERPDNEFAEERSTLALGKVGIEHRENPVLSRGNE